MMNALGELATMPQMFILIGGGVVVVLVTGLIETIVAEHNRWTRYYRQPKSNSWRRK